MTRGMLWTGPSWTLDQIAGIVFAVSRGVVKSSPKRVFDLAPPTHLGPSRVSWLLLTCSTARWTR